MNKTLILNWKEHGDAEFLLTLLHTYSISAVMVENKDNMEVWASPLASYNLRAILKHKQIKFAEA